MKRLLLALLCFTAFSSCSNKNILPAEIEVFSKTVVLNEESTEGLSLCIEGKENSDNNCVFYLNGIRYLKRVRYLFSKGNLIALNTFHSEGLLSYNLASLKSDSGLQRLYQTKSQSIKVIMGVGIIDNGDTITDYTIDRESKLILANKSNYRSTNLSEKECVIYEYK